MNAKTLLTADELERMPVDDTAQTELDEGELITMPPAGWEHGDIGADLTIILGSFVKKHRLGKVVGAGTGFRLGNDTVRAPDIAFVRQQRLDAVESQGFARGAPDLAVEIFSPSDSVRQLMRKVKQYFAAGCHTVWIVYPERQEIQVLEASGLDRLLVKGDQLESSELLPGFAVPVADLFA